jgi:hypothetical protein
MISPSVFHSIYPGMPLTVSQGVGGLGPLAVNAPLIIAGHSWLSPTVGYNSSTDNRASRWGIGTAALEYSGNVWRIPPGGAAGGNKAVSGALSAAIPAQVTAAIATLPGGTTDGMLLLCQAINSIGAGIAASAILANIATELTSARAAHIRTTLVIEDFDVSITTLTGPQQAEYASYRTGAALLEAPDVCVVDLNNSGSTSSGNFVNWNHRNTNGFDLAGAYIWSRWQAKGWMPTGAAKDNLGTSYTANPNMTGGNSGGPANWTAWDASGAGGGTVSWNTSTKEATFGGTCTGTGLQFTLQALGSGAPLPAATDPMEALAVVVFPAATAGLIGVDVNYTIYDAGFATLATGYASLYAPGVAETAQSMARPPGTYVMRAPPVKVAAGTPNYKISQLKVRPKDNAGAINFTLGIPFCEIAKAA